MSNKLAKYSSVYTMSEWSNRNHLRCTE